MTAAAENNQVKRLMQFGSLEFSQPLSLQEVMQLAEQFPDIQLERNALGKVTIMTPVKKDSSKLESEVNGQLFLWFYEHDLGEVYSPNVGIVFPDEQMRSPDAAWISDERIQESKSLEAVTGDDWLRAVPNFVVEVKSSSDNLKTLKEKMKTVWIANGVELGWLIDISTETIYVYQAGKTKVEETVGFSNTSLSADPIVPGFSLDLGRLLKRIGR